MHRLKQQLSNPLSQAFAWAECYHHSSAVRGREEDILNNTNTYFTVVDNEENYYQEYKGDSLTSTCWRLYIGALTLDGDPGEVNDVPPPLPREENTTGSSLILEAPHPQHQCCYITRTAKLKKFRASVERILPVSNCQCIVVAIRDTFGWFIVLYDGE